MSPLFSYRFGHSCKSLSWIPVIGVALVYAPQVSAQMHQGFHPPTFFPDPLIDAPFGSSVPSAPSLIVDSSLGAAATAIAAVFRKT